MASAMQPIAGMAETKEVSVEEATAGGLPVGTASPSDPRIAEIEARIATVSLEAHDEAAQKDLEEAKKLAAELVSSGMFPEGTGSETIILAEKGLIPEKDNEGLFYYGWVVTFGVFLSTLMVVGTPSGVFKRLCDIDSI